MNPNQELRKILKELKIETPKRITKKFLNILDWKYISIHQTLSESLIEKFANRVNWDNISIYQTLSEAFIEKFANQVHWENVSRYQMLSESFIEKFANRVNWTYISIYQILSEAFLEKYKNKLDLDLYKKSHKEKSFEQKLEEVQAYAKRYDLKFKNNVLYAYRDHDKHGRGLCNKTIRYKKGKYYRDWHCDMNVENENSFGLGIFPKGNTRIKVKVEDWGCSVNRDDGKARVWVFEIC